jgi:acetyl esterase/lipase
VEETSPNGLNSRRGVHRSLVPPSASRLRRTLALLGLSLSPVAVAAAGSLAVASQDKPGYTSSPEDTAHGDREWVLLWPEGAPGALGQGAEDRPKITAYPAPADLATGTAAVVCPGGSYQRLASDHEGKQVAEWLNGLGVSAFVLQYRVGPRYRHPAPLHDAQRALRLVRARARELGVAAGRVGIVGFSAGGHLASTAGTHFDEGRPDAADPVERAGSRPDFMVLAYPVISLDSTFTHERSLTNLLGPQPDARLARELSNERRVTARTPPAFLFHTSDDTTVDVENSVAFYRALRAAGVAAELHVFATGRHGVGLAPHDPVLSAWPKLCAEWMRGLGLLARR